MKTIEDVLKENPHNIRLWDDDITLDVTVDDIKLTFTQELVKFQCHVCENHVIKGNEDILVGVSPSMQGSAITCNNCNQQWFIHKPVRPD